MAGAVVQAIAEAGGDGQALDRHEVREHGTVDVEAEVGALGSVTLGKRGTFHIGIRSVGEEAVLVTEEAVRSVGRAVLDSHVHVVELTGDVVGGLPVYRGQRIEGDHAVEGGSVATLGNALGGPSLDGVVGTDLQPLEDVVVGVNLSGETLVDISVTTDDTVLVHVVEGGEVVTVLVTAGEGEGVLLAPAGLDVGADPVSVDEAAVSIGSVPVAELAVHIVLTVLESDVTEHVLAVHERALGVVLQSGLGGVGHGSPAFFTALGGHEHDTVTGLSTVDGGGGGVLQDLDGLDHGRIQVLDAAHLQTVHDVQRLDLGGIGGVGGITADADLRTFTRGAVRQNVDTGGLALEGGGRIDGGQVLDGVTAHRGNSTGEVALLLDTITDDDGFVNEFGVFDEDEAEVGPVTGSDRLIGITDAGDINVSARRDIETEDTVHISHCADGSVAHDDNGRSHDGNTAFIDNCSGNGAVLGGSDRTQEARCDDHHSGSHSCKKLPCHKKR